MSQGTAWNTLCENIGDASEIVLVSPYIKKDALTKLLEHIPERSELKCYTRWKPLDITRGVSDLACRELILNRNGTFNLHNSLHAKYYRLGTDIFIGSANLTVSGLSIFGRGNFEILNRVDSFDWQGFEGRLSEESRPLSEAEMPFWENLPVVGEANQTAQGHLIGEIADDWYPLTRNPSYLWLAYSEHPHQIPSEEQRKQALEDLTQLKIPPDLREEQFHAWVGAVFYSSAFSSEVLSTRSMEEAESWRFLSEKWSVNRSVAARRRSTGLFWVDYLQEYLLNMRD